LAWRSVQEFESTLANSLLRSFRKSRVVQQLRLAAGEGTERHHRRLTAPIRDEIVICPYFRICRVLEQQPRIPLVRNYHLSAHRPDVFLPGAELKTGQFEDSPFDWIHCGNGVE